MWNTELLKLRETAEFSYLVDKTHCDSNISNENHLLNDDEIQKKLTAEEILNDRREPEALRKENQLKKQNRKEIAVKKPVDLKVFFLT